MIWRGALIVKDINPALAAKVMLRDAGIPLIKRQRPLARRDDEVVLRHFHHNRPAHGAERTVASRELREVGGDLEADSAAMAGGGMGGHFGIISQNFKLNKNYQRLQFKSLIPI